MKSALMDAGLLMLILVGTAGAEGPSHLANQLQQIPQSFFQGKQARPPVDAIRVNTVSTNETVNTPARFQPQAAVPITGNSAVRVSTFRPAYEDSALAPTHVASNQLVARSNLPSDAVESWNSTTNTVGTNATATNSAGTTRTIRFSPPITYGTSRPVVRSASAKRISTTTYAPVVEIPDEGITSPPIYSPSPSVSSAPAPAVNSSTYYGTTPTPVLEPGCRVPTTQIQVPTATTGMPNYAYRPVASWVSMPNTVYVGRGIIGQPTVYVPRQPIRNFFRFLSP